MGNILQVRPKLVALSLAGCLLTPAAAGAAGTADPVPVNLAVMAGDSTAEGFYATDMGFFKSGGLNVTLSKTNNSAQLISAMMSGQVDVGIGSISIVSTAHEKKLPLKFFAPAVTYDGPPNSVAMMVANDSTVKTGADLNGQVVAINGLKDMTQVTASAWIDQNGGDSRTVKFIEIPFSEMAVAMQQHRVAAALMTEPFLQAAKPVAHVIGDAPGAVGKKYYVMAWYATDAWLKKNPEAVRRLRLVLQKTGQWANTHQSESGVILQKYTKMSPETIGAMVRTKYDTSGKLDPALMQPVIDAAAKYGSLEKPFPATELMPPL